MAKFQVGHRVEIHPGCDLWMRGARYGTITARMADGRLRVRMDHSGVRRAQYFTPDLLRPTVVGVTYGVFE